MTTALRRRIRHTRRWTGYGLLVLVILLALIVGVANQLLPMVESHPAQIARWLSARVGEPVSFSHARAEWTRRGPRFVLDGLHVGKGASQLDIGGAQLQVAMYSGLLPGRPLTELKIRELSLTLVQDDDGRWHVIGLPEKQGGGDPFRRLEGFGELQIERASLAVHAPRLHVDMRVPRVDARIRVDGPRLRVGVSAWVDGGHAPLSAVLDLQRGSRSGLLWVGGSKLSLADWAPVMAAVGVVPERGTGDVGMWAKVRDQRVTQVTVDAELRSASLRSVRPILFADGSDAYARVDFERLQASARWTARRGGWFVQAPRLNVTRSGKVARLDGLVINGGERFSLVGKELDLSPLASWLSLSDRLPEPLRRFMQQSNPQALLRDVSIHGARGGPLHGSMLVSKLSLQPHGNRPGLSGMAGRIQFDERGGVIHLDSSPVHVNWPSELRQQHDVRLGGTVALWKNGSGWTLGTSALRMQAADFGVRLRLQLGFQGDGSAPTLDLAARLDPLSFATAKQFWLVGNMPPTTVNWLDNALVAGKVLDGRVAIGGDLDDWPFRNQVGSFDARANVRDATLKFNPLWPAGEHLDLAVAFDGPGCSVTGRGLLHGNNITRLDGGIRDFHAPWLDLDIQSQGSGENLRQLMMASPLDKEYGEHLRALTIAGNAKVGVVMRLPLKAALGERTIDGDLDLEQASLADSRWDIAFKDVLGRTHFNQHGFATQNLSVRFANQPGVFNLRVGSSAGDAGAAALATLDGRFTAASLIDRYKELAWLTPWMRGSSTWNVAVRVPLSTRQGMRPPSQLRVSSNLVGTAISLPAPLAKAEQAVLSLELQTPLPIEQGDINLRLGTLLRLRAQLRKDAPLNGAIQFGDGAMPPVPAQGLSVRGQVDQLDSTGWVAFSGNGDSKAAISDIDVSAAQLMFVGRGFADTHLQLKRSAASTQVVLKGKGLEGTIDIPTENGRVVQGRFARMYVPSGAPAADAVPAAAPPDADTDDPAKLPPLRFSFGDLRIGQAQLGKADLSTTPVPNGMRVDKFQTQAKNLGLNAAGEWIRVPGGTRSSFKLDFTAKSLGQMLDALGYAEIVQGGPTKATLAGSWSGSPGAFGLATLTGTLKAEVGEGRLLDVEPGGSGRVLGLLSLAEIPRRLSLDFSDFFKKGFAFNTAQGDFRFSDGMARTDNLRIDGPAAEIRVSGVTGLRDEVYNQRVEVLPKAGGLLPAIGLIAGGPAGAAVGAMAQAVLQRPLKQTTRVVYRVTGPWAKPIVKVIEKGPSRTPPASETGSSSGEP